LGDYERIVNTSGTFHVEYFKVGNVIIAKNESGTMKFFHPDHIGSSTLITDYNGDEIETIEYYPFGAQLSASEENKGYEGKEFDSTGLNYFGARYYDSELRRWTQPDPVIKNIYNPQNLNRYSFELNNPYKYTDPDGRYVETAIDIVSIGISLNDIRNDPKNIWNWAALGADVVTLALPVAAGGGLLVKGVTKVDDVADGVKYAGKSVDMARMNNIGKARNPSSIKNIQLKGTYDSAYSAKIKQTHSVFKEQGYDFTEHAINRAIGRVDQGRISSFDSISDTLNTGTKYYDPKYNNVVISKNNVNVHISSSSGKVTTITEGAVKKDWSELS